MANFVKLAMNEREIAVRDKAVFPPDVMEILSASG